MKNRTVIRSYFQLPVVAFLFFCFLSSSCNLSSIYNDQQHSSLTKQSHGWGKSHGQLPFEEKEKEAEWKGKNEEETNSLLESLIRAVALQPIFELKNFHSVFFTGAPARLVSVPIYITKRTLLI
jgi:hypothetical protein